MRDKTSGGDLLQVAREALLQEVLPSLAGQQRYAALMVANALKMVERELAVNGSMRTADLAVQELAGHDEAGNGAPLPSLCRAIRAGRHDGDARAVRCALHPSHHRGGDHETRGLDTRRTGTKSLIK